MSSDETKLTLANTIHDLDSYCPNTHEAAITINDMLDRLKANGGIYDLPALVFGGLASISPRWDVDTNDIKAFARFLIHVLQQDGYDLSGTVETTRYNASTCASSMVRTRTQFSFNEFGETYEQIRQSVFITSNGNRGHSTSLPTITSFLLNARNDD